MTLDPGTRGPWLSIRWRGLSGSAAIHRKKVFDLWQAHAASMKAMPTQQLNLSGSSSQSPPLAGSMASGVGSSKVQRANTESTSLDVDCSPEGWLVKAQLAG